MKQRLKVAFWALLLLPIMAMIGSEAPNPTPCSSDACTLQHPNYWEPLLQVCDPECLKKYAFTYFPGDDAVAALDTLIKLYPETPRLDSNCSQHPCAYTEEECQKKIKKLSTTRLQEFSSLCTPAHPLYALVQSELRKRIPSQYFPSEISDSPIASDSDTCSSTAHAQSPEQSAICGDPDCPYKKVTPAPPTVWQPQNPTIEFLSLAIRYPVLWKRIILLLLPGYCPQKIVLENVNIPESEIPQRMKNNDITFAAHQTEMRKALVLKSLIHTAIATPIVHRLIKNAPLIARIKSEPASYLLSAAVTGMIAYTFNKGIEHIVLANKQSALLARTRDSIKKLHA